MTTTSVETATAGGETTSSKAIVTAMTANTGIALAKLAGFVLTGSSAMLGEAVHSAADASNQGLLYAGHKSGNGKAWSIVAAFILLGLSGFTVWEGVGKLTHPEPIDSPVVALSILGVSMVLEGFSLFTAVKAARSSGGLKPELMVILCEDSADLVGLVFAVVAVSLAAVTRSPLWDGVGTVAIGGLLSAAAVLLLVKLKNHDVFSSPSCLKKESGSGGSRQSNPKETL